MRQFFDKMFWRSFSVIVVIYLIATLAYQSDYSGLILFVMAVASAFLSYKSLHRGLALAFLELFCNPHGVLVIAPFFGFSFTLRMAIFVGVMLGWGIGIFTRRYHISIHDVRLKQFILLALAIAIGFIMGGVSRDPSIVFSDGNAYFFLLYIFPILSVHWTQERRHELLQLLASGAVWVLFLSLGLLYVFSHFGENTLRTVYTFFRDLRVAEITNLGSGAYRIFIQSQTFVVIFGLMFFSFCAFVNCKRWWILFESLIITILLLSLSRSFWVGLAPAVVLIIALICSKGRASCRALMKQVPLHLAAVFLGVAMIYIVVLFPIPPQRVDSSFLAETFKDRAVEDQEVAISSRWNLLRPMVNLIIESPLVGHGFGKGVTFQTDDPRAREVSPDGTWTTYSMEWGWLELWIKMGLLGPVGFLYLAFEIVKRFLRGINGENGWLSIGLIASLVFIYATHLFSPYLNHPIGLGLLLFLIPFLPTKNSDAIPVAVLEFEPRLKAAKEMPVTASRST
jgi:hypothetical protein